MVVCHRHRCIFIHIPRCGGTSINRLFLETGCFEKLDWKIPNIQIMYGRFETDENCYELDHATVEIYKEFCHKGYIQNYFKFAIVRNPWERLLSEYLRKKARGDKRFIDADGLSFKEFVLNLAEHFDEVINSSKKHILISHFIPQYKFIFDENDRRFVDFICKLEDLDNDWKIISRRIALLRKLDRKNSTKHNHYSNFYDDKTQKIVNKLYSRDIELFGYTFENRNKKMYSRET